MKNWTPKPFREIATFPPKVSLVKEESYSFIPMDVVNEGYKFVSPQESKKWVGSGGAKFENGDTLFARITPCLQNGKIAQAKNLPNGKGFGSTEFFVFRGKENVSDSNFVYYLAKTEDFRSYAIGSMVGASGRQRADATYVGNYEVNLPPLPIQKRIAEILSAYDDLIENNLNRIKLLYELSQIKFKSLNRLNLGLKEIELDKLSNFLGRGVTPVYEEGTRFFAINQKANKGLFLETQHFKEYKIGNWVPKEKFAMNGDVIINSLGEGTIGRCHFYKWEDEKYPIDQHMSIFRGKTKAIGLYVYQFLDSDEGQGVLYSLKKGGTNMTMLNINDLRNVKVSIPSDEMLDKYYAEVEPLFAQKAILEKQNQLLKQSRDILLPRLMNGSITVTPES